MKWRINPIMNKFINNTALKIKKIQKDKNFLLIRKTIFRYTISFVIFAFLAIVVEIFLNINSIGDNYEETINPNQITKEGVTIFDSEIIVEEGGGQFIIDVGERYVKKLSFDFTKPDTELLVNATITIEKSNTYGEYENLVVNDSNPYLINKSIININEKVKSITIAFSSGQKGVCINNIKISNKFVMSKERIIFFTSLFFVIYILILTRKKWADKTENIFIVLALTVGTLFVVFLPVSKVSWDEEAHFKRAYTLPISVHSIVTPTVNEYSIVSLTNWPFNITQSKEEKVELAAVLDTRGDYRDEEYIQNGKYNNFSAGIKLYDFHYLPSAIGIKVAQFFNMSFYYVYMLGRWFNLLAYSIIIFFAIKKITIGKNILAVIALMPTPLFLASVYSYDAMVIALITLGFSYMLYEYTNRDKIINCLNSIICIGAISVGSLAKAVYIPIILFGLLMPKNKFRSKKQMWIYKITIIILFLILMSTFVLPSIISPPDVGDVRGGSTSTSEQLSLIFSSPFSYASVLIDNIKNTFLDYSIGKSSLGLLAHISSAPYSQLIIMLVIIVVFTDARKEETGYVSTKEKVGLLIFIFMIITLIWTALYLSFTEVGKTTIAGVQGRYYIPILFPLMIIIRPRKILNNVKKDKVNVLIYGLVVFILFSTIYECVLTPYNL